MNQERTIGEGIYIIGGPGITHAADATSFIVECGTELVMIDSGAGKTEHLLVEHIEGLGLDPGNLSTLILTHCHIDHIGAAPYFKKRFGCTLVIHNLDADAVESGDPVATAANLYGTTFPSTHVDTRLSGDGGTLSFGGEQIHWIHTPGHTPGSLSIYCDRGDERILFGQDIHGPFLPDFGSDIGAWKRSMMKLFNLEADILCEGHFGIFRSKERVRSYIMGYLTRY
ncbi:MAG: MBL fold metallo-hydrolase [Syntrophales bacterium]|jgi:glyoxylase-like metal-dependent hydrolase (beta-lactamase superfamily II)|nr:MBL fold metallo-hydrolase [Syntrophales bacterium]